MSEKQTFLEKLHTALIERDISESDIAPYLERFDRFYDRMVNDSSNTEEGLLEDVERIADNIAEQVSERYDEINRLAERTLTVDRVKSSMTYETVSDGEEPENDSAANSDSDSPENPDSDSSENSDNRQNIPSESKTDISLREDDEPKNNDTSNRPPEYIDEEPSPTSTTFYILCAASLPITLPLALVGLSFFAAGFIGLAGLILASIALLVIGAAVGTALSLVGVIYGVSQLFTTLPVGLYELGLGIMVASGTVFCCILLYNFAIRLLPVLIRLWGRFFGFALKKLRMLFMFVRRECAKV